MSKAPHKVLVVGVNHRTAPLEVREQLAFDRAQLPAALQNLVALSSIEEGAILSTCNRVEVIGVARDEQLGFSEVKNFLEQQLTGFNPREDYIYCYSQEQAVRHLFRVASSLDSMVVGEPQILGQLKYYYAVAHKVGSVGPILHRLFHRSFSAAKRVRQETGIANRPVSVSSVAVDLAKRIFDRLEEKTVMVIGSGRMGELLVRHLVETGVRGLMVTNRTFERAVELAEKFQASPIRFEDYTRYLKLVDMVIGSVESAEALIRSELIAEVLRERKQETMFLIDLGVPRNFDPRINDLDNVYLYHVDDLMEVANANLKGREVEANKGEEIIDQEVSTFRRWLDSLGGVPTIVALRRKLEEIRLGELRKSLDSSLKELSDSERKAVEDLTTAMVNKILHAPLTRLKERPEQEALYHTTLRELFQLDKK